jgi:hypothetical protein
MAGIAVFSSSITSQHYRSKVMEFASNGRLAYVIADESICFGTNYPFVRVFVDEKFAMNHSIAVINQVMARAGRMGLAWKATAFLPSTIIDRFTNYVITGKDSCFDEGKNLSNTCKFWLNRENYCKTLYDEFITGLNEIKRQKTIVFDTIEAEISSEIAKLRKNDSKLMFEKEQILRDTVIAQREKKRNEIKQEASQDVVIQDATIQQSPEIKFVSNSGGNSKFETIIKIIDENKEQIKKEENVKKEAEEKRKKELEKIASENRNKVYTAKKTSNYETYSMWKKRQETKSTM